MEGKERGKAFKANGENEIKELLDPFLSVVIPVYNHAKGIASTVFDVHRRLSILDSSHEIIVVNDGSTDKTPEVVTELIGKVPNVRLFHNRQNQGKGAAVRKGIENARGAIRLFMDADNSTSIENFDRFIPFFNEEYDVVIGSRATNDAQVLVRQSLYRVLLGTIGNMFVQFLLLPGVKDTQCGFKGFTQEAAQRIFPKISIHGWGFDIEVLALARQLGLRIKEVGVSWVNDPHSHFKVSDYFRVFRDVIAIRSNIWLKKYM